jgi:nucleoporin SEH1
MVKVHWLPPSIYPSFLGSISTDGKFRLWGEDPRVPNHSGRRFNSKSNRPAFELRSSPRRPYVSFSFKHDPVTQHTFLAILNRNSFIEVYENDEPENMGAWNKIDEWWAGNPPNRGEESSFKIMFDPNPEPCYAAVREGVSRDSLGLIVASMNTARLWRSKTVTHTVSLGSTTAREFYAAAELSGHTGLVRDVAWAPGNIRGHDLCATVCSDGYLRIYEIYTPKKDGKPATSIDYQKVPSTQIVPSQRPAENGPRSQSGIGAGLAGSKPNSQNQEQNKPQKGEVLHVVKEVAKLTDRHAPFWRVKFDADGQIIGATGDSGTVRFFKRLPNGSWAQSSELSMDRPIDIRTLNVTPQRRMVGS